MKKHPLLLLFLLLFSYLSSYANSFDDLLRDTGRPKGNVKEITVETKNETAHRYYSNGGQLDSVVSPNRHISLTYGETKTMKYKLLNAGAYMEVATNKDSCIVTFYDPISGRNSGSIEYFDEKGRIVRKNEGSITEFKNYYDSQKRTLVQKEYGKDTPNEVETITETKYNANGDVIEIRVTNGKSKKFIKCSKYNNNGDLIEYEDTEQSVKYSYTKPDTQGNWTECTQTVIGKPFSDKELEFKRLHKEPIRGVRGEYTDINTIKRTIVYY